MRDESSVSFLSRGARASVILHEEQLHRFIEVWRRAKASGVKLPDVGDPDYASHDALLSHVLRWSRTYLIWICEKLDLAVPVLDEAPVDFEDEDGLTRYTAPLLAAWRDSLQPVSKELLVDREYPAPWGALYCIDAMLEHAVMHPLKHRFQLEELLGEWDGRRWPSG